MSAGIPIKRGDIKAGDRVRSIYEYTADNDHAGLPEVATLAYELIERPVVLPTEPGLYVHSGTNLTGRPIILTRRAEGWTYRVGESTTRSAEQTAARWQELGVLGRLVPAGSTPVVPTALRGRLVAVLANLRPDGAVSGSSADAARMVLRNLIKEIDHK